MSFAEIERDCKAVRLDFEAEGTVSLQERGVAERLGGSLSRPGTLQG